MDRSKRVASQPWLGRCSSMRSFASAGLAFTNHPSSGVGERYFCSPTDCSGLEVVRSEKK